MDLTQWSTSGISPEVLAGELRSFLAEVEQSGALNSPTATQAVLHQLVDAMDESPEEHRSIWAVGIGALVELGADPTEAFDALMAHFLRVMQAAKEVRELALPAP